jgi:hypothetical protein
VIGAGSRDPLNPRAKRWPRLAGTIVLGFLAGTGLLLSRPASGPGAPIVDAAGPGLTMVGAATYDVRPASRLVHVTIQLAVTNHLLDTVIRRYTFDRVDVSVPPTAAHPAATAGSKKVGVSIVSRNTSQEVLSVSLGGALGSGRTSSVTLAFDLPDPGGSAGRPIRVGLSLVTFPVWAYGSAGLPGSTVVVRFPAGYDVRVVSGPLAAPVTAPDGSIALTAGPIRDPLAFNAVVAADRPSSFVETKVNLEINGQPASLVVRAWPDDPAWGTRMSGLIRASLPLLANEIGLPFEPSTAVVAVEEALPRSIDGYAATYLPAEGRIQIAYTADDTIAIHELAHLWFDGSLFSDRWIADGFAIFYGNRVAQALKLKPHDESITPALAAAALPLNAWTGGDALAAPTGETPAAELADRYGRAAAVTVAGRLYTLVGADGLQAVWRAASGREAAYQPKGQVGPSLVSDGAPEWRGFLDLIAERTGVDATAIWSSLVVTPDEEALLSTRTATRSQYQALLSRAASWAVPQAVLDALNAWQFSTAADLLSGLDQLLDQRARIAATAASAGLTPPVTLQAAFEHGGRATGVTEASNELQVIQAIGTAASAEPPSPSLVDQIGLIGVDPAADLDAAATAFSAGDMVTALDRALAADEAWSQAGDTGGFRVRISFASLLVGSVLLGFLVSQLRRLRHLRRPARRRAAARAARGGPPARSPARSSRGTLADQPVRMARRVRPGPEEGDESS